VPPGRPEQRRQAQLAAMACMAATWPCGTGRVLVTASPAGGQLVAFSPASIRSMTWSGSADRLATVSFLTVPASR